MSPSEIADDWNLYNRPGAAVPADVGDTIRVFLDLDPATGIYRDEQGRHWVAAYSDLRRHVICDRDDPFFCSSKELSRRLGDRAS